MDLMELEILEDGTISVKTDKVSSKNHASADGVLDLLEELVGGERNTEKRKQGHVHTHSHKKQTS